MSRVATSLARIWAVFLKELLQMKRDKLTFGMMLVIPLVQLVLFGYAINSDPKHLPTALVLEDPSPLTRTLTTALETSDYYDFVLQTSDPRESAELLARGDVAFVVTIPTGFTRRFVRGERPAIHIEADASDPAAASNALAQASSILSAALASELRGPLRHLAAGPPPFELVVHRKYNPEGVTQYNIVPGLLGVILTMTMVMITAIAMTRELERGTMENLLAMPARPFEVMVGKIMPFLFVGGVQTAVILIAARHMFGVPFVGEPSLLLLGVAVFVTANLALGFTFSTLAQSQMQAMQLTFFFFLPSMLLSGFMFPYRGMPPWAQTVGEVLPLTHFLRLVRGVMLKGASLADMRAPLLAMSAFTVVVVIIAMLRYRRTLD